jgi:serine/threonine protein kinase
VLSAAIDDDSTIIGGRATDSDTTYIASVGKQIESKGNSEAGRLLKNRFVLEEKVGSGGMGDVYKALDLRAQEQQEKNPYIAIKLLNESFAHHKDALVSLQREAAKTKSIPHKNIMGVYDFDREGDTVYMTMELLTGKPLDDYLKEHPEGVSVEDAWNIIDGISQGLSRAHGAGIVHSDFKPGNIFYTADKTAKVFDFGIARAVENPGDIKADGEKTVFDAGSLGALTPTYASYEMLKGSQPSKSDDVYAVALVAYELFTGRHPYDRVPADKAFDRGMEPKRIPFLKRRHWKTLRKGLQLKGDLRTQSVDEFHEGMFSVDPPVLRYTAIAAVLMASIGFGAYNYLSGPVELARELLDLQNVVFANENTLREQLADPKWSSEDWHQQIKTSFNRYKLASSDIQTNWADAYKDPADLELMSEAAVGQGQAILDLYLDKVDVLRLESVSFGNDWPSVLLALEKLKEADKYLQVVEESYRAIDSADVTANRGLVEGALQLRNYAHRNYTEKERLALEAEAVRQKAAEAQRLAEVEEMKVYDSYGSEIAELKDILRCKGNIPSGPDDKANYRDPGSDEFSGTKVKGNELAVLGQVLNNLERINRVWFERDQPKIAEAIAACIMKRIAIAKPLRAREIKAVVMTYLPDEPLISSIDVIDRDPCLDRDLEGNGNRSRSFCEDQLTIGNTGPRLVVIPGFEEGSSGKFAISRTEVTVVEYNNYCEESPGCVKLNGGQSLPATNLSVAEAKAYTGWLSKQSGRSYRLPSVEEWHHAAKTDSLKIDANVNCTVDSRGVRLGETLLNALSGRPNSWGLYNHVGNAREWAVNSDGELSAVGGAHTDPKSECSIEKSIAHSGQADPVTGFRILRQIETSNPRVSSIPR